MPRLALLVIIPWLSLSCDSSEAECHRRARQLLQCCPFCEEDCQVSKDVEAQFAAENCLAAAADPAAHQGDDDERSPASAGPPVDEPTPLD
jgi:hypothetical protein